MSIRNGEINVQIRRKNIGTSRHMQLSGNIKGGKEESEITSRIDSVINSRFVRRKAILKIKRN